MAILPAKTQSKAAKQHATGARFRQRKISVKQPLTIYKQRDLPSLDNELEPSQVHHLSASSNGTQPPRDLHSIETGVDKNEEDEVHLQQVINAAQKALMGSKTSGDDSSSKKEDIPVNVYIPTPDASRLWPEAHKYYNDQKFKEPKSNIKFSATVEDTVGVEYNMDEIDEEFFKDVLTKSYPKVPNAKKNKLDENTRKCTELEFETICDRLEKTIESRQPFLSMDPTNILSYEELSTYIIDQFKNSAKTSNPYVVSNGGNIEYLSTTTLKERLSKELNYEPFVTLFDKNPLAGESPTTSVRPIPKLFELFGKPIYEHWKERKIERKGKSIQPMLKFEDPNANEKDNDSDPYVCFRRREFRQARKTRRADTLGAERIRMLQKSLHRARDLVMCVNKRELLKLENLESEIEIFKLRCEGKNLKRAVGIKGDDYLYYPHKRKKIVKPKEDEEEKEIKRKERRKQEANAAAAAAAPAAVSKDKPQSVQQQAQDATSTSQAYVKLPPSKIPDMELVTVSLVLKEKNETIKRAVLEKLRKRKEQDKGFVNLTNDPYEPHFDISTNNNATELSHIPYSSIAATNFHQINTSNYIGEHLKKLLEEGKPLPGVRTFRGSNGELIPTKAFPHLLTLLQESIDSSKYNSSSYIAQLLQNIETNNFNAYNNGYGYQQRRQRTNEFDEEDKLSDPIARLRKRASRNNRVFIDRRGLISRPDDVLDEFMSFSDEENEEGKSKIPNVYDCRRDVVKRLDSNWLFDNDLSDYQNGAIEPFSLDPSKLNCISDETQSIRFGSMLLSKSYGLLKESVQQKQQLYMQQARMRALQQQQLANKQQAQAEQQAQIQQLQQQKDQQPLPQGPVKQKLNNQTPRLGQKQRPISPSASRPVSNNGPNKSSPSVSQTPSQTSSNSTRPHSVNNNNLTNRKIPIATPKEANPVG